MIKMAYTMMRVKLLITSIWFGLKNNNLKEYSRDEIRYSRTGLNLNKDDLSHNDKNFMPPEKARYI